MKKQLFSFILGGTAFMLSANISFAQEENFKELPPITVSATSSNVSVVRHVW
jgi:hypothetical protein